MAVFRVERTGDYTVMSNFHLKDKRLSLKAKGLLSQMLSLPDDWDYTLSGLSYINRESKDAIRSAVNELETAGYIRRRQTTDASGKFAANEYTIFERPIEGEPMLDKPLSENPITVNPSAVNPLPENPTQLNTKKSNTQKQNTHGSNTDSIPFRETAAVIPPERKGRDAMSVTEIENYRELILENIEYDCLKQRYPLYLDDLNEIVELLVETVCAKRKTTRISGADFPHEIVRSRFLKLDSSHIEFVMDSVVEEITGESCVESVKIKNVVTGEECSVPCAGIFIAIGRIPETELFGGQIETDKNGYIVAGEDCKTSIDGVYAVGDVRTKALRQIVTACADGANAVKSTEELLTLSE